MRYLLFIFSILFCACANEKPKEVSPSSSLDLSALTWGEIEKAAQNSTVDMMMWQGDPLINAYMRDYVAVEMKKTQGISLNLLTGQGNLIVQQLMAETQAGKAESELDMMWINGETFFQLKEIDGLFGPFVDKLPNSQYLNLENPFIGIDFQQKVNGMECPWGNVQMAWIYNQDEVPTPPQTVEELAAFVKQNPGRFTFDSHFTGMTFLKALLIHFAGGKDALNGDFDEAKYKAASAKMWAYLKDLKPNLWKNGQTFPENVAALHQLFATGEVWFSMSNNDAEADNKVLQGVFSNYARAYVPAFGSIQNSHYLGIAKKSGNPAGAMVVIDFLISPEAQNRKQNPKIWGDGSVLSIEKLPEEWKGRFLEVPNRKIAPPRSEIEHLALMELAPEYMIRLYADFNKEML